MKKKILPILLSLLIVFTAGCSLLPPIDNMPTPTSFPPSIPPSGYAPLPGDDQLRRDKVFLDLENSSLLVMESYPIQVSATLNGSLSDPCHQLRVVITPANKQNQINLEVYSVYDPNMACITVIQPFSANIPLGSFKDGHYSVTVNGEMVGEFDA
jgi:hypothetical protein